jgi:ABC-type Fe3+/spermidine/putrescine transport system ATPase subunit
MLAVKGVTKRFHATTALDGVSVEVERGEFMALVGPSGCGKTTLLRMIGGFEVPSEGQILIDGKDVTGVPPAHRPTSMVFQRLALFPHKTVADNISFPLTLRRVPADQVRSRVEEMARLMDLDYEYLDRYPNKLSGGEQQRVALARSLIASPSVLLLDEPLSSLDVRLRKTLQAELKRLHRDLGVTFVHVTHDLEEAMILADRIGVMRGGRIMQVGAPADIYYRPENDFVAQFIGDTNLFDIVVIEKGGDAIQYDSAVIQCKEPRVGLHLVAAGVQRGAATMMVRPERVRLLCEGESADCRVEATIEEIFVKGSVIQCRASLVAANVPLVIDLPGTPTTPVVIGERVSVGWSKDAVFVFQSRG